MFPLTAEYLRTILHYDADTGEMRWLERKNGRKLTRVGSVDKDGYRNVAMGSKLYLQHRVAWFYMTGEWPIGEVDHINGIRADNRWCNLRVVTRGENRQNQRKPTTANKSGFLGVYKFGAGWGAAIGVNNKNIYLGTFKTPELAHQRYLEAKRELHVCCTI